MCRAWTREHSRSCRGNTARAHVLGKGALGGPRCNTDGPKSFRANLGSKEKINDREQSFTHWVFIEPFSVPSAEPGAEDETASKAVPPPLGLLLVPARLAQAGAFPDEGPAVCSAGQAWATFYAKDSPAAHTFIPGLLLLDILYNCTSDSVTVRDLMRFKLILFLLSDN